MKTFWEYENIILVIIVDSADFNEILEAYISF